MAFMKAVLILTTLYTAGSFNTSPTPSNSSNNLKDHVLLLETSVSSLQSQFQAQEQKYSAVISNVLSQLTQTKEELNTLQGKYDSAMELIRNLTNSSSFTDEEVDVLLKDNNSFKEQIMETMASFQNKTAEIESGLTYNDLRVNKLNETLNMETSCQKDKHSVGFLVEVDKNGELSTPLGKIIFPKIRFNTGSVYSIKTGEFVAPVSGLYQFWVNAVLLSYPENVMTLIIDSTNGILGYESRRYETTGRKRIVTFTTVANLSVGDRVWLRWLTNGRTSLKIHNGTQLGGIYMGRFQ